MPYDHKIVGRIIRDIRQKKGLTQEVLSGLAGLSRSHLAEIESGRTKANVDTLWKIAEALEMNLSELIQMTERQVGLDRQKREY